MIEDYMRKNKVTRETLLDRYTLDLVSEIEALMASAELASNSQLVKFISSVKAAIEQEARQDEKPIEEAYVLPMLISEIMKPVADRNEDSVDEDSPRVFVLNLPEADDARFLAADLINGVFRRRKKSFSLSPRVLFVFDEAQEFLPQERRKEDGTDSSSRAVEKLLRHGRKYHLHGWISTQRIAHLNTNALQQLHSYFVSTMPRPYDRQLISDQFAISDAFIERTLLFQNGDWLLTSFKATSTQNVPVLFHALNNEEVLMEAMKQSSSSSSQQIKEIENC
jgi:DNA helicase HerA-like ATPase